jgi:hypothetical protein
MLAACAKAVVNGETVAVAPLHKRRRTSSPCVLCPPHKSTGKLQRHQPRNCPTLKAQNKTARAAQQASRAQVATAPLEPAVYCVIFPTPVQLNPCAAPVWH